MEDPDAKTPKPYVHWVLYNVPPETTRLPESVPTLPRLKEPKDALQGRNSRGQVGYTRTTPSGRRSGAPLPLSAVCARHDAGRATRGGPGRRAESADRACHRARRSDWHLPALEMRCAKPVSVIPAERRSLSCPRAGRRISSAAGGCRLSIRGTRTGRRVQASATARRPFSPSSGPAPIGRSWPPAGWRTDSRGISRPLNFLNNCARAAGVKPFRVRAT